MSKKVKYQGPAYGLGNYRKVEWFSRIEHDFDSEVNIALEVSIWSSLLLLIAIIVKLVI